MPLKTRKDTENAGEPAKRYFRDHPCFPWQKNKMSEYWDWHEREAEIVRREEELEWQRKFLPPGVPYWILLLAEKLIEYEKFEDELNNELLEVENEP